MLRPRGSIELVAEKKPFQSRFLPNHQTPKKDETESSSEEEETTSEESEDEDEPAKKPETVEKSRSSQARESYADSKQRSRDDTYSSRSGRYSSPSLDEPKTTPSIRTRAQQNDIEEPRSRYGTGSTSSG